MNKFTFKIFKPIPKFTFILLVIYNSIVFGQINLLRYNDNFDYLRSDSIHKKGFDKLKHIKIYKNSNISFGGELREQFQYYNNLNFGDVPPSYSQVSSGQIWQRAMIHTNIELGNKTRVFSQLGSTFRFLNPNPLTPEIDQNQLSLHQAFIEHQFRSKWSIRMGRQELFYGNHRLLTFREGPNTRLTFDGAVFKKVTSKRKVDVIAISPVTSKQGVFDDTSLEDFVLGTYVTEQVIPKKLMFDFYSFDFISKRRKYNSESGKENRQVLGMRLFSENPIFNYEVEGTYQYGTFGDLNIRAYSLSTDINYKIIPRSNLVVGIGANYVSGDKGQNDNRLNTYNLIFSKPQYGLTAPIGASNIITINPYIKLNNYKNLTFLAGVNLMWRQSTADGTYAPNGIEIRPNPVSSVTSNERQIGTLLLLESNYNINSRFSVAFDASYFFAGKYIKQTGKGNNITYLSMKANYKF